MNEPIYEGTTDCPACGFWDAAVFQYEPAAFNVSCGACGYSADIQPSDEEANR